MTEMRPLSPAQAAAALAAFALEDPARSPWPVQRHYLDPGPRPKDLPACICADWFAQGETDHLPDCPRATWTCACRYMNWGPICTHCGKLRPPAAPEGW